MRTTAVWVLAVVLACASGCVKKPPIATAPPPPTAPETAPRTLAPRVGPDRLYPNPSLTPGKAATVTAAELLATYPCPTSIHKPSCTYSEAHRNVSNTLHIKVYDAYQVPPAQRNAVSGEIDHFDPLCNGGSNDISNLWYQPAENVWNGRNFGYHEKDALEAWVCREVKAGKLDPKIAFERITTDWVAYFLEVKPEVDSRSID